MTLFFPTLPGVPDVVSDMTPMAPPHLVRGKYRDWMGDLYQVTDIVRDIHAGAWMVLYRSLINVSLPFMVMSYDKFFSVVDVGGHRGVPRFTLLEDGVPVDRTRAAPPPLPTRATKARAATEGTRTERMPISRIPRAPRAADDARGVRGTAPAESALPQSLRSGNSSERHQENTELAIPLVRRLTPVSQRVLPALKPVPTVTVQLPASFPTRHSH